MNIPKQLLMTPQVQLYSFILMGSVISFIWPLNMLYVFLLTRAYSRDKSNLFKSFWEETMEQSKNTITLINQFVKKFNKEQSNVNKQTTNSEVDKDSIKEEDINSKTNEYELRKRKTTISNNSGDEDVDTI